jgi:ABC-2 type transport system ATP-binding protein
MLKIEGLSFRYPGREQAVLDGIALDIPAGGIFGLLGPNGAGKTTLISILAGQLRAAAGRIAAGDASLQSVRERRPHSLGLVPQELAFYPMLTALENLRFFGAVQGLRAPRLGQRIAAVAQFARIENVLERRAAELSGGLKRRLNLAIGLLTEPQILLLDEPTVGVDPQSRAFLLESIRALCGPGRIIVYTSHYMEEVQAICDHVAIIDAGRVLLSGALGAVLGAELGGESGEDRDVVSLRLRVPGPEALARATEAARAAGCEPLGVDRGPRDLEQVFMRLTHRSLRD